MITSPQLNQTLIIASIIALGIYFYISSPQTQPQAASTPGTPSMHNGQPILPGETRFSVDNTGLEPSSCTYKGKTGDGRLFGFGCMPGYWCVFPKDFLNISDEEKKKFKDEDKYRGTCVTTGGGGNTLDPTSPFDDAHSVTSYVLPISRDSNVSPHAPTPEEYVQMMNSINSLVDSRMQPDIQTPTFSNPTTWLLPTPDSMLASDEMSPELIAFFERVSEEISDIHTTQMIIADTLRMTLRMVEDLLPA